MISDKEINNWRKSWKRKSNGKLLSITGVSNIDDIIDIAVQKGYAPSIQNTAIKQYKYDSKKLAVPRKDCEELLKKEIKKIYDETNITEEKFEEWESNLASEIREKYKQNGIEHYTYGNAQKWINMTIKFVFSSENVDYTKQLFNVCYLPIDRIIQDKAYKELGVKKLPVAWSKCDDWNEIQSYQKRIKDAIIEKTNYDSRLWWECNAWTVNIEQVAKNILNKHKKAFVELAK